MDDPVEKNSFLESAKAKGYDVLVMDGQLDNHYVNWYESKHKDARFVRVDSDVIDKLIQKDETLKMSLSEAQQEIMRPVFESQMPKDEKIHYNISFEAMAADAAPVVITQNEFMRRMKEMAAISSGGMSQFYSQMPDNFTIAVNGNNPIVIDILADVEKSYGDKLKTITKRSMLRLPKSAVSTKWSKARKRRNSRPRRNRRARSFRRRSLPCATSAIRACAKSAARTSSSNRSSTWHCSPTDYSRAKT